MMSTMKLKSLLKEKEVCLFTLEVVLTYVQPIYESTIDYYRRWTDMKVLFTQLEYFIVVTLFLTWIHIE
jgi:hypothetical protein